MLLFSSLSHEKLAPLNNISDMTECALSKVSQAIEKAKKEVINNNVSNSRGQLDASSLKTSEEGVDSDDTILRTLEKSYRFMTLVWSAAKLL
jgi:hypothetical protein